MDLSYSTLNFIANTAKDYDMEFDDVKTIYIKSKGSAIRYHELLEFFINKRRNK